MCWNLPCKGHMEMVWLQFPICVGDFIIQILIYENISAMRWNGKQGKKMKRSTLFSPSFFSSIHWLTHSTVNWASPLCVSHCMSPLRNNCTISKKKHSTCSPGAQYLIISVWGGGKKGYNNYSYVYWERVCIHTPFLVQHISFNGHPAWLSDL